MVDSWRLAHGHHAIAGMAVIVNFSTPVPDRAVQRMLKAASEPALAAELRNILPVVSFSFNPAGQPSQQVGGQLYNSLEAVPNQPGLNVDYSRQFQVEQNSIVYRTSLYRGWKEELADIERLFQPVLAIATDVVGIQTLRIEYRDVFYQEADATLDQLLRRECKLIAPHVFDQPALWHSYAGYLLPRENASSRVVQVNLDYLDVAGSEQQQRRLVQMTTVREDRQPFGQVDNAEYNADMLRICLEGMHGDIIGLLNAVIQPDVVARMK